MKYMRILALAAFLALTAVTVATTVSREQPVSATALETPGQWCAANRDYCIMLAGSDTTKQQQCRDAYVTCSQYSNWCYRWPEWTCRAPENYYGQPC
jgi:hypothetical protein